VSLASLPFQRRFEAGRTVVKNGTKCIVPELGSDSIAKRRVLVVVCEMVGLHGAKVRVKWLTTVVKIIVCEVINHIPCQPPCSEAHCLRRIQEASEQIVEGDE